MRFEIASKEAEIVMRTNVRLLQMFSSFREVSVEAICIAIQVQEPRAACYQTAELQTAMESTIKSLECRATYSGSLCRLSSLKIALEQIG